MPCDETNRVTIRLGVHRGVGRHIEFYGFDGGKHFYLSLFVCEILYTLTLGLAKFSILLFFLRNIGKISIRVPILILAQLSRDGLSLWWAPRSFYAIVKVC